MRMVAFSLVFFRGISNESRAQAVAKLLLEIIITEFSMLQNNKPKYYLDHYRQPEFNNKPHRVNNNRNNYF